MTVLHQLLTVDPHFMRRGCAGPHQILHFATCLDVRPARSLQRVAHAQKKFTFHHMFGRRKRTISADGCCGQRSFAFHTPPHVFPSDTCDLRRGLPKDNQDPHFATRGCPCRQREIEEQEKSDFAGVSDTI